MTALLSYLRIARRQPGDIRVRRAPVQSIVAPDDLITALHFRVSAASSAPSSSGDSIFVSAPSFVRLSRSSTERRPWLMTALSLATTAGGLPAGATTAVHEPCGKSAKPDSCMVGTSGNSGQRAVLVTASGRSLPARMEGTMTVVDSMVIWVWPANSSVNACAAPL